MAFSRGLFTEWLRGVDNQKLVHGRFGKKRGVFVGEVLRVERDALLVKLSARIRPGDGVVFDAGHPEESKEGGRVFAIQTESALDTSCARLRFGRNTLAWSRIRPGQKVWKTSDPALERFWRQSFAGNAPRHRRPVLMRVSGRAGEPLALQITDDWGHTAVVWSDLPLEPARRDRLTPAVLEEQLRRLGGSPFYLAGLENGLEGDLMLPFSALSRLRRLAVEQLEQLRCQPRRWAVRAEPVVCQVPDVGPAEAACRSVENDCGSAPELIGLVRTLDQLEIAPLRGLPTVYCEFEDLKQLPRAFARMRRRNALAGLRVTVWAVDPRIHKPGEDWMLRQMVASGADGFLVRNVDQLVCFAGRRSIGDYTLNVANHLATEYYLQRFQMERVTASYDLDASQGETVARAPPPGRLEVTLHQHMPMFRMEHYVFCAFLSGGRDYRDCGRPCDKHTVQLLDRVGVRHLVRADAGCRNTVYNARAQTGAEYALRPAKAGVRHFRIEFLDESPGEADRILSCY
ncbi:MAG: DUF3656 domain-containing protein [Limisphaera sp.]|nr:DUF3656 domain-containing protein [Limisphaera sp.]